MAREPFPYPGGSRWPGGRCKVCDVEIRATYNWRTGRHATHCQKHAIRTRPAAVPRRDVVDRVRAEIDEVGVDAFVRRRVLGAEEIPPRLIAKLASVALMDEWRINRSTAVRLGWTPERRAILDAIARGLQNKEIAAERNVSIETVKTQIKAVYALLDAANRGQAISAAYRRGLVTVQA